MGSESLMVRGRLTLWLGEKQALPLVWVGGPGARPQGGVAAGHASPGLKRVSGLVIGPTQRAATNSVWCWL